MSSLARPNMPPASPALLKDNILLFATGPYSAVRRVLRPRKPRRSNIGFRTRPIVERHVSQNLALWRSVQNSAVSPTDAEALYPGGGLRAILIPRQLHAWLAGLPWADAEHAVLCILHDATCAAPEWRVPERPPARLAPSVAIALGNLQPHPEHCPEKECAAYAGRKGKEVPLVTPASMGLDELLTLAGERLWTVPAYTVVEGGDGEEVVEALRPHWEKYVELAGKGDVGRWDWAVGFTNIVIEVGLTTFWQEVDVVFEMGGMSEREEASKDRVGLVGNESDEKAHMSNSEVDAGKIAKRQKNRAEQSTVIDCCRHNQSRIGSVEDGVAKQSRKGASLFARLPKELLTEHIIPSLCMRRSADSRARLSADVSD